jgi:hypothetical protein
MEGKGARTCPGQARAGRTASASVHREGRLGEGLACRSEEFPHTSRRSLLEGHGPRERASGPSGPGQLRVSRAVVQPFRGPGSGPSGSGVRGPCEWERLGRRAVPRPGQPSGVSGSGLCAAGLAGAKSGEKSMGRGRVGRSKTLVGSVDPAQNLLEC